MITVEEFAEAYANAELPAWSYATFVSIRSVAPVKTGTDMQNGVPDVRPQGVGECL